MSTIPSYQQLYPYILDFYKDQRTHELREAADFVARNIKLSEQEKEIRTSTGTPVIRNRVSWAHTYLKHAGLIESVSRGVYKITTHGLEAIRAGVEINNIYLHKFDSFKSFKSRSNKNESQGQNTQIADDSLTPEEQLDSAIKKADELLADELLEELRNTDPYHFEKIVTHLLDTMGYGDAITTKKTNDGGIDAVVNEDALGLSKIFAQAKRYAKHNTVNKKELQNFVGAMQIHNVNKGVFITTSSFNETARSSLLATQKSIVLIDGDELAELMIRYDLGVTTQQTYKLRKLDSDFFVMNEI